MNKKIFYLHIPKNSGTTLTDIFKRNYKNVFVTHWNPNEAMHHSKITYKDIEKFEVITGHYPFGLHKLLKNNINLTYVTMLRNPIQRLQSAYNYLCNDSTFVNNNPLLKQYLNNMNFDDFTKSFDPIIPNHLYVDNGQVRYLSGIGEDKKWGELDNSDLENAKKNLENMIFGITEEFEKSIFLFKKEKIFEDIHYVVKNKGSNQNKSSLILSQNKTVELDLKLYEYALTVFNKRFK